MEIDFFKSQCQSASNKKLFGLCDEQDNKGPAYIDENNKNNWIVEVENKEQKEVHFVAIDNCIEIRRDDDVTKMEKRCDGMLWYETSIVFVELKERVSKKNTNVWVKDGEKQIYRKTRLYS